MDNPIRFVDLDGMDATENGYGNDPTWLSSWTTIYNDQDGGGDQKPKPNNPPTSKTPQGPLASNNYGPAFDPLNPAGSPQSAKTPPNPADPSASSPNGKKDVSPP